MKKEIFINGNIGENSKANLASVKEQVGGGASELVVYITSEGGEVDEGYAIYDYLKSLNIKVTTVGELYVYSIATVVFLAGDVRLNQPYCKMMIHNPWGGVSGDADTISEYSKQLRKAEDELANFYSKKTGIQKDKILSLMKQETYLDAFTAQSLGFSTGIAEGNKKIMANKQTKACAKLNFKETNKMELTEKDKNWFTETFSSFFSKYGSKDEVTTVEEEIKNTLMLTDGETEREVFVNGDFDSLVDKRVYVVTDGEVTEEVVKEGVYTVKQDDKTATITVVEEGVISEVIVDEVKAMVEEPVVEETEMTKIKAELAELKESFNAMMETIKEKEEMAMKEKEEMTTKLAESEEVVAKYKAEKEEMFEEVESIKNKVLGGSKPKNNYKAEVKPNKTDDVVTTGFMGFLSTDNKQKLKNKIK